MNNPFRQSSAQQPFLSPLGKQRRSLPAIAMPLTVTIIGGIALVAVASILFSGIAIKADTSDIIVAATPAVEPQEDQTDAPQVLAQDMPPAQTTDTPPAASPASAALTEPIPTEPEAALSFNAPIASNEAEIAVLEVIQMPPAEEEPMPIPTVIPEKRPATPQIVAQAPASSKPNSAGLKNAVTNRAVNMRASPDKNAPVLGVVPANVQFETQANCSWCAITYEGNQGYIYKSFIDYR